MDHISPELACGPGTTIILIPIIIVEFRTTADYQDAK